MAAVNAPSPRASTGLLGLSPALTGTVCCVVSALAYTGSNICARRLAELHCDEMWVIFNKELVTVLVVGFWMLYRMPSLPSPRVLALLVAVGLTVQLGANLGVQWTLGVIGLAITVPTIFGTMLTSSAVLERVFLGERVSRRSIFAIGLLIGSLVLLGIAAGAVGKSIALANPLRVALGVATAGIAGVIYSVLTITVRHTVTGPTPKSVVVWVTTLMGVLTLGPLSVWRLGIEHLLQTPRDQALWMLAAGILNLIAFLAITKALECTTAVHANMLNASQVAMAAVAGMALFNEPLTPWLAIGVGLTIVGIVLFDRAGDGEQDADQHA